MTITLDTDSLRYIAALEKVSGARVVDCICEEDKITYVIQNGQLGAAIGKAGANVKKLTTALGKKIHLVELDGDPLKFTANLIGGEIRVNEMNLKEIPAPEQPIKKIIIETNTRNRGTIVGKGGKNIEMIKNLLKRHHGIDDVIVR
ncbi:TPA: NusA-like transcription termination signal-binding factor [archaeon]|nr:NusA-like transcription termination signal-binding factor [Candidatus Naiadarchaeales archaeon SRR2090153.bin461]HIK02251.1 NusA-like transcription termination signal-binding factor [Candidatus Naiadarchaeales archaeon SRR2090159.bin1288]